jgi:PhnB protein
MPAAKPIPDGFHSLTPHIVVKGAAKAIDFYKQAFGAEEINRAAMPDGSIMHALCASATRCSCSTTSSRR